MKNLKTIGLVIGAFITGVIATLAILYIFVLPNMATEIGVFATENAMRAYDVGYADGKNETDNFEKWFDEETIEFVENYEYKFIK